MATPGHAERCFLIATAGGRRILAGMADITRLLDAASAGDPTAAAELLPLVYDALRELAAARMAAILAATAWLFTGVAQWFESAVYREEGQRAAAA